MYDVFCSICGHQWDMRDPGVSYRYMDAVWECHDESLCFERKAMAEREEVARDADR
jgi:hypothetical protein